MQFTLKTILKGSARFILLLLLFHMIWLVFYYLSASAFFEREYRIPFIKQLFVNSLGFIAFYLGAFWLFPAFISKRNFTWLGIILIIFSFVLGKIQFRLQDWQMELTSFLSMPPAEVPPVVAEDSRVIAPAAALTQSPGSDVRAMFNIFIFFLFGIGYAYAKDWILKDRRAKILEKEKLQSELALLRYQLNPHFLFNTINDIYYLALIKSDTTPDALMKLSNLLRYVLNEKEEWVSLDKELEHLEQFIQLHKFRFPDEVVQQQKHIDGNINKFYIAPLLLITFVENAFKHGEPGTEETPVTIHLSLKDGLLNYQVINHVPSNISKDSSSGIGISNLERRLALLYPGSYQLSFEEENDQFIATLQIDLNHDIQHSYR